MDDISSFGPSGVVAVGLKDDDVEQLQEACSARRYRLVVAARRSDLPLSLQGDFAIVNTLLPDGDGRRLATDFARTGARVLLIGNAGSVPLFDAWSHGATTPEPADSPADWLDDLARVEQVEAVSRAGRLMEPLRLSDAVDSAASFSGSSGVPVSFVRIRPRGADRSGIDEVLDRLTSVVGMTTVFYDAPTGERIALVINGDRRRLAKLLDGPGLKADVDASVVEVSPEDDLAALVGRSLLNRRNSSETEDRTKVLMALAAGHEKTTETIRMALHRMDFSPLLLDAGFSFEDGRSNRPAAVVIDARQTQSSVLGLLEQALSQIPPIPVLVVSDDENVDALDTAMQAGASDFLTWPFQAGDVQATLARVMVVAAEALMPRPAAAREDEGPSKVEVEVDAAVETVDVDEEPAADLSPETESRLEPQSETLSETDPEPETQTSLESEAAQKERADRVFATALVECLAAGEPVTLKGVGIMSVTHETSRIVHDKLGRTIVEPPRRRLSFVQEDVSDSDGPTD